MSLNDTLERHEMHRFLNRLRILHSLETYEVDPERQMSQERRMDFIRNPVQTLLRMDGSNLAMVWAALRKREG